MAMVSVIIPAHNESENLSVLLPRLHRALTDTRREFEILLIDNASTDDTQAVVRQFGRAMPELRLVAEPRLGYGRAVLAGFRAARGDVLATLRADNQERPEDLCRMIALREAENLDLYKAIRLHRMQQEGVLRVVVSFVFNKLSTLMLRVKARDINASPKVLTRAFYESARLESPDWFIDAEIVIKAEHMGIPIGALPIEYHPRLKGRSTARPQTVFEFLKNMLRWRVRLRTNRVLA
jgi:glycosyltransferase involved in cell wall biosynthesis